MKLMAKITDGKVSYSEAIDTTEEEYLDLFIENPDFFKEIEIGSNDIERINGTHFLYGWFESIQQSDETPLFVRFKAPELTLSMEQPQCEKCI
jgi:hypothetical protein